MNHTLNYNLTRINMRKIAFSLLLLLCLSSCSEEVRDKLDAPKNAFGSSNQLCVIADQELWDSNIGDTLRYYFAAAYPILPQPEPFFDLKHFTPAEIAARPSRKELRSYLLIGDFNDVNSEAGKMIRKDIGQEKIRRAEEQKDYNIIVGKDKWAQGQLLIYLFAQRDQLIEVIQRNYPAVSKRIEKTNEGQFESTIYFGGENVDLKAKLKKQFDVDMRVPVDYFLAIQDESTIWMRKETDYLSSNIIVHKIPYTDQSQLTKQGLKGIRNAIGKKYISTEIEGTYMRTNDIDLPMLTQYINIGGHYTLEARGIWDIVNDFMGGPFVSYLIHNANTNELLFIDCFIHAPGKKKRDFVQHLEYIVGSINY
ncbi:MAG: DUF4837 family protein [Bacteroidota bacterium]